MRIGDWVIEIDKQKNKERGFAVAVDLGDWQAMAMFWKWYVTIEHEPSPRGGG